MNKSEAAIFLDNPARLIAALYELGGRSNLRRLFEKVSKEYGSSFTALYNAMHLLEKEGYITVTDLGREKIVELTEKGRKKGELFVSFIVNLEAQR
uniref:ORF95 n=1 Tax=Saccharolobus islandicus TaxID=43080 RepID=Q9C4X2_SACIS|nr:hypothetical protein [Sulfolobus islandicus]AAK06920.1 ORF95 [Sulfolobus islandicus]